MEPKDNAPSDLFLDRLTDAMLELAPESGWTRAALDKAAEKAGLSQGQALLAAPNGVADVLAAFGKRAARAGGEALALPAVASLKVREKVRAGVKGWLAALAPHKAAVKRAAASPANLLTGPKGLWAAADAIWSALGDKSTDYNWYTKRMTLVAVLGSTLAAWLGTDDAEQVDAFLDRRIENVMQFEKFKAQARSAFSKFPDPLDILGQRKSP
ncbi:MAG: COQ9 family protein [Hyphomonadaceae bacterium]